MKNLVLLLAILLVVGVLARFLPALLKRRTKGDRPGRTPLPYEKKRYLFSKAEKSFYLVLLNAVPKDHVVFAKVRVADVLLVKKGTRSRQSAFNRISAKHLDFVVCDREWLEPRLAIELDDASHEEEDRQDRDRFLDRACKDGALPLLRITAARGYEVDALTKEVSSALRSAESQVG